MTIGSERTATEQTLERLTEVFDELGLPGWLAEAQTLQLTWVSAAAAELLGKPRETILALGDAWTDHGSAAASGELRALCHRVAERGEPHTISQELAPPGRQGSVFLTEVRRIERGGRVFLFGRMTEERDIRRTSTVHAAHQQQAILDALPSMIWLKDAKNRILRANRTAAMSVGLTPDEMAGKDTVDLYPEQAQSYHLDDLEVIRSGQPKLDIVEKYSAGTDFRWVRTDKTPYRNQLGEIVGVVVAATDVTAWKQAEEERTRLYERLKELDALKTRFFSNVSHELRSPIALILGLADRLLKELPSESQQTDLQVIIENAQSLRSRVDDLLDAAKLAAGRMRPAFARTDLPSFVRRSARAFDALAADRGVLYRIEAPEHLAAEVDPAMIQRVLANLLSNAFRHTPTGGQVVCRIEALREDRVGIQVDDSGRGVPQDMRQRILERFFQLPDSDPTGAGGGTGLGLAIVKDLVELHGGSVVVEDSPLGGARFSVTLSCTAPAGTTVAPSLGAVDEASAPWVESSRPARLRSTGPEANEADDDRPRILVVEDNVEMNHFLVGSLSLLYRVESAFDGLEGLRAAEKRPPDLILTDVMMPKLGGEELVRALRDFSALDDVPIVVLTARADDLLRVRVLEQGAQDYMTKPFSPAELLARIGNLVAMKRAREVLQRELTTRAKDVEMLAMAMVSRGQELQATTEVMRIAREQADHANQHKTNFLRLVTHELVTPLTSIKLGLELVRNDSTPLPPHQKVRLARCAASAGRLHGLIDSLLEHARVESGHIRREIVDTDMGALADELVEEMRPLAEAKHLALSAQVADLEQFSSDPRLIRLILSNLLGNALKFTDQGSILLSVKTEGGRCKIAVEDTGPGIAHGDQARAFEAFAQLQDLDRKHLPGIGLGLALVKELVHILDGLIRMESEPGHGTTIRIELPTLSGLVGNPPCDEPTELSPNV